MAPLPLPGVPGNAFAIDHSRVADHPGQFFIPELLRARIEAAMRVPRMTAMKMLPSGAAGWSTRGRPPFRVMPVMVGQRSRGVLC